MSDINWRDDSEGWIEVGKAPLKALVAEVRAVRADNESLREGWGTRDLVYDDLAAARARIDAALAYLDGYADEGWAAAIRAALTGGAE